VSGHRSRFDGPELPSAGGDPDALLIVRWDGRDHFFSGGAGAVVRFGGEDIADLVVSHPLVSRQHAVVFADGNGWQFRDASEDGSYVDGRRVRHLALTGPTDVRLGDPITGAELLITPVLPRRTTAPDARPKGAGRTLLAAVAALLVLVVLLVVGWLGSRAEGSAVATAPLAATEDEEPSRNESHRGGVDEGEAGDGQSDGPIVPSVRVVTPPSMGMAALFRPDDTTGSEGSVGVADEGDDDLSEAPAYRARSDRVEPG